jgi:hypothetical protein
MEFDWYCTRWLLLSNNVSVWFFEFQEAMSEPDRKAKIAAA